MSDLPWLPDLTKKKPTTLQDLPSVGGSNGSPDSSRYDFLPDLTTSQPQQQDLREQAKEAILQYAQEHKPNLDIGGAIVEAIDMSPPWARDLIFNVAAPIAEFFQFGHDAVVSVVQDLYYKGSHIVSGIRNLVHGDFTGAGEAFSKAGDFPLTVRTIKNFPKYFPGGDRPERPPSMSEFLLAIGLPGWAAAPIGLGLDIALDPLTWVGLGEVGGAKLAERYLAVHPELGVESIRVLTPKQILEIADRVPDSPLKTSLRLAAKTKAANQTFTPAGLAKALIPSTVRDAVRKGIVETLDRVPVPFAKEKFIAPSGRGLGVRTEGMSVLKFITPRGKYEELKLAGTPHAEVAKNLLGGGDILNPSTARAGELDYANNIARHLQAIQLRATKDMFTIFKKVVGKNPDELPVVFKDVDHLAASFADRVGPALFTKISPTDNVLSFAEKVRKNAFLNLEESPTTKKYLSDVKSKLRNYEKAYNLKPGSLDQVFDSFVRNYWATHVLTGYYLSGMHILEGVVRGSLNDIKTIAGVKDDAAAADYAWRAIWSNSIAKVPPREVDKKIFDLIQKRWKEAGLDKVYSVSFQDYIKSLYSGYLRRVIPVKALGSETASELLARAKDAKFRIYPVKWLDATNLVNATQRVLGKEAADKLAATLAMRGDGAISTETIANITGAKMEDVMRVLREAGMVPRDFPLDEALKVLTHPERTTGFIEKLKQSFGDQAAAKVEQLLKEGQASPDAIAEAAGVKLKQFERWFKKTYGIEGVDVTKALEGVIANQGIRPTAALEIGAQKWQERKLSEEALGTFLADAGLQERVIAYAHAAGRTIKAQEFIRAAYSEVSKFIKPFDELRKRRGRLFDQYGVEYVKIPNSPDLWGPLAGQYIPRYVADPMLKVVEIGDSGWASSALAAWRQMALSSPATVARNIDSGIDMMLRGTVSPLELISALKQVVPDYIKFLRTGMPTHFGPGWEYLNLYSEGKLYGEALQKADDEFLKQFSKLNGRSVLTKLGELAQRSVQESGLSPLVWFERSEDIMRLAAYKVQFKRLVRAGISPEEAGRAAAHFANNILFNYANQAPMTVFLKKYGLAAFPAFPYFNIGRTWRIVTERPLTVNISDYAVNALNVSQVNDPEELKRRFALVHGTFMQNEKPIIVRFNGHDYYVPLSQVISTSATDPTQTINEVATLGLMRTALSLLYTAINEGETPPWEARYGRKVYDTFETPARKALQAARFATQQFVPGLPRQIGDLVGAAYHAMVGDVDNDYYLALKGKTYSKTVDEALLNFLISTRQIGPAYAQNAMKSALYQCQSNFQKNATNVMRSGDSSEEKQRKLNLINAQFYRCVKSVKARFK